MATAAAAAASFGSLLLRPSVLESRYRHQIPLRGKCRGIVHACSSQGFSQFVDRSYKANLVPLFQRIFSDHLTPILAYRCLVKEDEREAPSFLFESVEHADGISKMGRFSYVGAQPAMEIVAKEDRICITDHETGLVEDKSVDDPFIIPRDISSKWLPAELEDLPEVFCGGWVGYFSYDTVRYSEKRKLPFSMAPLDDRHLPDIHLGLYKDVVVFDHVSKIVYAIHWVDIRRYDRLESAYDDGMQQLEKLVFRVQNSEVPKLSSGNVDLSVTEYRTCGDNPNMTSEEFKEAVLKAKEHILSGDIFQIVLSRRFERRTMADPFEVYRALRIVNPSPYMIYLQARGSIMVASSPEILTRIKKNKVVNRPLAGTRRRGSTEEEDKRLEQDLLADDKERAEHVMLVDLGRNDVGKVSKPGSVVVEKFMEVERYSHVMHISSTVTGELREGCSSWDALRAALPVGTVSGAPKVRAMQLIDELERTRRGPYSGGIGGVAFNGDMDIALALRTMVFPHSGTSTGRKEWLVHLQAGAGVVADSDPDAEYAETENKAAGLGRAIDLAEATFIKQPVLKVSLESSKSRC